MEVANKRQNDANDAMRKMQEATDARLAAAIADALALADARVAEAQEAAMTADAQLACSFLKAEEVAAQHAAEVKILKTAAAAHDDQIKKLRITNATTMSALRLGHATQIRDLTANMVEERKVVEMMNASRRKLKGNAPTEDEDGANTCIICLDEAADQMPFECQHVVMCPSTSWKI